MVGFRKDTTTGKWVGAVKTQLEISPDNEETRAKVSVQLGVVTGDNITLVGSAQRVDAESIAALSQSTEESEFFRVIAWFDDQPDKKTKSDGRIRFVSLRAYLRAINSLQAGFVDYITAAGGRFLAGFIRDTGLLHATVTEDSVIPNEATHNTGVLWESVDESYTAPVRLNTFGAESYVANAIRQHSDFKGRVSATLSAYEPEVLDWEWDSAEHTFGPWSMPGLIEFNALDLELLNVAIHGAQVQATLQVTVRQADLKVTNIAISGQLNDLYDFDYNAASPAHEAAIVQAGYDTLGNAGHVYRVRVILDKTTYPFDYKFGG